MTKIFVQSAVCLGLAAGTTLAGYQSSAGDLSWTGRYRAEGVSINNPYMGDSKQQKSYVLHHAILFPKIVAADGLNIYGRFDILNTTGFENTQMGQFFGSAAPSTPPYPNDPFNVQRRAQPAGTFAVNSFYLQWANEHDSLIVGRVPTHFGLGMLHNAGNGLFDHWFSNRDILGYKMVTGNIFILPMIGKVIKNDLDKENGINDYMVHFQYENPETDLTLGVFYEARIAGKFGNDLVPDGIAPGQSAAGITANEGWNSRNLNIFVQRKTPTFDVSVEAGFQNGQTGLKTTNGGDVNLNGYGIASELTYRPEGSKLNWGLKAGIASGDDPNTTDVYEGYAFHRNYDVGVLLFNHYLGNAKLDALGTKYVNGGPFSGTGVGMPSASAGTYADVEYITNSMYLAPNMKWIWNDNWSFNTSLIYANLMQAQAAGRDKALGFEWDFGITYSPHEHLVLKGEAGILMPGSAFSGSSTENFSKDTVYGLTTKIAVTF